MLTHVIAIASEIERTVAPRLSKLSTELVECDKITRTFPSELALQQLPEAPKLDSRPC